MRFAAGFWLFAWAVWWVILHEGAQGVSPVFALIGLLSIPVLLKKRPHTSKDVLAFILFLTWAVISSIWSPAGDGSFFTFDLSGENLAINSPGLRIGLVGLILLFAYWAMHQLTPKTYGQGLWAARIGIGTQVILMVVWLFAFGAVLAYGMEVSDANNLNQNMIRIVNACVLCVPLIPLLIPDRYAIARIPAFLLCMVGLLIISIRPQVDAQAAMLAVIAVTLVSALACLVGRSIYRWLGYATAAVTFAMPLLIKALLITASGAGAAIPVSFQSRLDSYAYTLSKIQDRLIFGWGLEASKTWDDTKRIIAPNGVEVDYKIVPGHPHNMGLHLWAETGLIGALLLSCAIVFLGRRLADSQAGSRATAIAGAGIWGGALIFSGFSYSLWNDAYWALILFIATAVLAAGKALPADSKTGAK